MNNESLKATKINLFSIGTPQMKAFHITWMTFFLCFFGWFGIAPLMVVVREELHLTKAQVGNIMIASVVITIFARLLIGWICDKIGPRITYSALLLLGSIPVTLIGFSDSYESFLLFRLCTGIIGASFVITQFHTSLMFAPNVVGTANATTAGWGNLGGAFALMVMPLIYKGIISIGFSEAEAWRYAMVVPGALLLIMAFVYYNFTQDTPEGNILDLKKQNVNYQAKKKDEKGSFLNACKDYRVWILFLIYGCSFGVEITVDSYATMYFVDEFELGIAEAGIIAGSFPLMNLFARALGGIFGDKMGNKFGLRGRTIILGCFLFLQGIGMLIFSQMEVLTLAVISMISFALFVKMSNGATYSVVPFINKKYIGSISGIVGAGGNVGAVLMGFLLKADGVTYREGLWIIGIAVSVIALLAFFVKFPVAEQEQVTITDNKVSVTTGEEEPALA